MSEPGDCILEDNARLKRDLMRCLKFIQAIPDDQRRRLEDAVGTAWQKELWAIKREVKA